ncbi:PKD domain-containing protein [Phototrophicus methaneseepsis]|uniref:PKD domain-containing protein n=1 Tax=Phototrophicus methaneseepsis TaxID=2710758 RepID=A0A7S8ICZ9_9CHLR|nr:PKD domain-containing protein [Phototrophicus methaneseepsis]QPC82050.1 PKD domain-containing protein [Phototrophicus methaneseepsis]
MMTLRLSIFYVLVILVASQFGISEVLSQSDLPTGPNWNVPETFLCPSGNDCAQYTWVDQDLTLYVISLKNNRLAVVPPDGSGASTYDVSDQLQPYPQGLKGGIAPLEDRILLYRLSISGHGIDILQLDRNTGLITELALSDIVPTVSCSGFAHISRRAFFAVDQQRVVLCSEGPSHNFSVHVVDIVNQTVEQTLNLGKGNLAIGLTRPWADMEVGLDGNIYFRAHPLNLEIWGIEVPADDWNYQIKYDISTQVYSLSPMFLPPDEEGGLTGPALVDQSENKYIFFRHGTVGNFKSDVYKIDLEGNILWHLTNPPLPDRMAMMNLIDEDYIATSDIYDLVVLSIPSANAGTDQTVTDTDNNGSENVMLDGSASTDRDGTIVSYIWTHDEIEIATGISPQVTLPVGIHTILLTITDDDGLTNTDTVVITVEENPQ